jgi:hypothetical protein
MNLAEALLFGFGCDAPFIVLIVIEQRFLNLQAAMMET